MQITRYAIIGVILCGVSFLLGVPHDAKAEHKPPEKIGSACNNGGKEVVIYYINGAMTDSVAAYKNRLAFEDFFVSSLARALPPAFSEDKVCFIIDNLENSKVGVLGDLLESVNQLDQLAPRDFWLSLGDVPVTLDLLTNAKLKLLNQIALNSTDSSSIDTAVIQDHAAKIASDIRDHCRNILLVPHSQGNLYAHMSVDLVLQDSSVPAGLALQSIRIIGIASPDVDQPSSYRGIYSWRTNHRDVLMGDVVDLLFPLTKSFDGLVRQVYPKIFSPNTDWLTGPIDWLSNSLGHGFVGYLTFQPSRDNIRRTMIDALISLSPACDPKIARIVEFPVFIPPHDMTVGPDGNIWFTLVSRDANKIGRITPFGTFTEFPLPSPSRTPIGITAGPDGNVWFTELTFPEVTAYKIGRITPSGVIQEFPIPISSSPLSITTGHDGNLWYTTTIPNKIGRITPSGAVTEFPIPSNNNEGFFITAGPDGNLWFTETEANKIGRITPSGTDTEIQASVIEFPLQTPISAGFITAGSDGNLWFIGRVSKIWRITPFGTDAEIQASVIDFKIGSTPSSIAVGPDGNLWLIENGGVSYITRFSPSSGTLTQFSTPASPFGITVGPDGNVWFTAGNKIGRLTPPRP